MIGKTANRGIKSGGAFNWFFQRISGAMLLLALLAHFWVLHFFPPAHGEITYDSVMQRLQHPAWKTIDLSFLIFGLYHGVNGVLIVVHDYIHREGLRLAIVASLWIAAIWLLVLGALTILGLPTGGIING
jgi:succinate dehydrogenase / fumarate reductase, membrane anchor subunit